MLTRDSFKLAEDDRRIALNSGLKIDLFTLKFFPLNTTKS